MIKITLAGQCAQNTGRWHIPPQQTRETFSSFFVGAEELVGKYTPGEKKILRLVDDSDNGDNNSDVHQQTMNSGWENFSCREEMIMIEGKGKNREVERRGRGRRSEGLVQQNAGQSDLMRYVWVASQLVRARLLRRGCVVRPLRFVH
ncbi:hypothetical protein CFAM422_006332 [Trichoderma lentiforme]|uniref:Uncharacterized protein n=1 Tax=Trichoderma lentiforme TaxID=1567552 RepID=A0A9P4XD16_9HYPO|nr:hypothetical protein CFAM422_006332 [Trichoderma lentiforme]